MRGVRDLLVDGDLIKPAPPVNRRITALKRASSALQTQCLFDAGCDAQ
jgi:hypothetical protein